MTAALTGIALFLGAPIGVVAGPAILLGGRLVHRWHTRRPLREYASLDLEDGDTPFHFMDGHIAAAERSDTPPLARLVRNGRVGVASQRFLVANADSALVVDAPHIHVLSGSTEAEHLWPEDRSFEVHIGVKVRLVYLETRTQKIPGWVKAHLRKGYRDSTDTIEYTTQTATQPLYLAVQRLEPIPE